MAKKMLIDATHPEETRVVVVDGNKVEEFDFETLNKRQLAGNIYLAKVTRVEPSLQAAFVDYGGNRHGFLAFAEIHPDYYQIPVADRKALIEEERALARAEEEEDNRRSRSRKPAPKAAAVAADPVATEAADLASGGMPDGMEVIDLEDAAADGGVAAYESEGAAASEGTEAVAEAPTEGNGNGNGEKPYRALDHASDTDDEIESIAEEDVAEEISQPRRTPRARRYKIQEVIKVRQIMLVQVVKEERGNKGAALTTYLSLAGRYCVLMPNTARGGGISRKITNAADRKKLKEIASELEVPEGAGLIIRTAGAKRTKPEIRRDYEYLMRLWEQIRELTLKSIAPAPIYEEGDLIKRSIRDLYSKDIDEVLVEGERGYRVAKDFMKMIMPSHAKNVKHYNEQLTLFARFQVESYLGAMFNPTVQLKSGGYIVIGVTEALVAIDVNSGRATKEGSIEDTAVKTNLEAAEEIARQLRLRDLAGLIVIDFIDMEERKNNAAVEKRLKDKLKTDRARIQVGRISGFGLLEMSRQRLRPGMLESTTQPCPHCHGTGLIRSDDSLALQVLRAIEEEGTRKRSREVLVRCPVAVANYLMNAKREHIASIEARYGMAVRIEADPSLVSPDFSIEKFKTATRIVPEAHSHVVSASAELMAEIDEAEIAEEDEDEPEEIAAPVTAPVTAVEAEGEGDEQPKKKKRRRRRRKKSGANGAGEGNGQGSDEGDEDEGDEEDEAGEDDAAEDAARAAAAASLAEVALPAIGTEAIGTETIGTEAGGVSPEPLAAETAKPKKPSRSRSSKAKASGDGVNPDAAPDAALAESAPKPAAKSTRSKPRKAAGTDASEEASQEAEAPAAKEPAPKRTVSRSRSKKPEAAVVPEAAAVTAAAVTAAAEAPAAPQAVEMPDEVVRQPAPRPEPQAVAPEPAPEPETQAPAPAPEPEDSGPPKPKRRGWWSLGG